MRRDVAARDAVAAVLGVAGYVESPGLARRDYQSRGGRGVRDLRVRAYRESDLPRGAVTAFRGIGDRESSCAQLGRRQSRLRRDRIAATAGAAADGVDAVMQTHSVPARNSVAAAGFFPDIAQSIDVQRTITSHQQTARSRSRRRRESDLRSRAHLNREHRVQGMPASGGVSKRETSRSQLRLHKSRDRRDRVNTRAGIGIRA